MKKSILFILTVAALASFPAYAKRAALAERVAVASSQPDSQNCQMQSGDSYVSVNFNTTETDAKKIKSLVDAKLAEAEALAAQAGLTKVELQSMNYNINTNSGSCTDAARNLQVYGSFSFNVGPSDKAPDLIVLLVEKGYTASLNVSMQRQCK